MTSIKCHCIFIIALLACISPVYAVESECGWPDHRTQAGILPVATDDGSYASGVVIAENRVLTAAHAVVNADQAFVRVDFDFRRARVISVDQEKDLAVMVVDTDDIDPIPLSRRDPYENEPVWAIGFPHASSKTTSAGKFQNKSDGVLHTSAPIYAGESGGGLIACDKGDFVLAGMLRGYGAYIHGNDYIKIANHSVSVAARDIQQFVPWSMR